MAAWRAVLAASLAMPLLMQLQVVVADAPQLALPASITTLPALPSVIVSMQPGAGVTPTSIDLGAMLTTIYLVIAAALVMRLAIGLVRTWRLRQAATPVSAAWTEGADVRVSGNLLVPVAFASTILLPETYTSWSADKRPRGCWRPNSPVRPRMAATPPPSRRYRIVSPMRKFWWVSPAGSMPCTPQCPWRAAPPSAAACHAF
jgi:hypothetical protein